MGQRPGSGGAGRRRGSPSAEGIYGPRHDPITLVIASDSQVHPPQGVLGGSDGQASSHYRVSIEGAEEKMPGVTQFEIELGEKARFLNAAGGGYGDPLQREPERVLSDVLRGFETVERARNAYGVVLTGSIDDEDLAIDDRATASLRAERSNP